MPTLALRRAPHALFLERVGVPLFFVLLALTFGITARWYAVTEYAPQFAVTMLFAGSAVAMLAVAWAFARFTPWRVAIHVSTNGAVTVMTTRGEILVPAGAAYGVLMVRYGIALKYRGEGGRDAWVGIDSSYIDEGGNHLSGAALIDRINTAIGPKAAQLGRNQRVLNTKILRFCLVLLGLLAALIGIISAMTAFTNI